MNWDALDWEVLDRLRETFLAAERPTGPYWHTVTDLECYDLTFGERIGWKWDAVLRELRLRGWAPPPGAGLLDWGCGSGVAGRRVAGFFGAGAFSRLMVHDRSPLAVDFAVHAARSAFPQLAVEAADRAALDPGMRPGVLLVSHVLNELDAEARLDLARLIERSECVLWVEPGTHEVSRALLPWRDEALRTGLTVVAPCPHQRECGLLAARNERHWCHHFAAPPAGIHADSGWVRFGQRAGIDLRSLPYSFLVLDRRGGATAGGVSRILGEPRFYKGHARVFNCSADGVEELTLQQRVDARLFKDLKRARGPLLYRWTRERDRIVAAQPA